MYVNLDDLGKPLDEQRTEILRRLLDSKDIQEISTKLNYNEKYVKRICWNQEHPINHKNAIVIEKAMEIASRTLTKLITYLK